MMFFIKLVKHKTKKIAKTAPPYDTTSYSQPKTVL